MKKLIIFCTLTLTVILILPFLPLSGEGRVYTDTIRLHVLANSDSEEDQSLKLKVRDVIIGHIAELTEYVSSRSEAAAVIEHDLEEIESIFWAFIYKAFLWKKIYFFIIIIICIILLMIINCIEC